MSNGDAADIAAPNESDGDDAAFVAAAAMAAQLGRRPDPDDDDEDDDADMDDADGDRVGCCDDHGDMDGAGDACRSLN